MSTDASAFRARPTRFLGPAAFGWWKVKRYAISDGTGGPRPRVIEAGDAETLAQLTSGDHPSSSRDGRQVWAAFTIIHEARPACFLQINQWRGVDLVQHYLTSPLERPQEWRAVDGGAIGCVWELPVIAHERDAWVRHVLSRVGQDVVCDG